MTEKKHTVAIVGLGFGKAHIRAFQVNGCEVVAVCQRDGEKARAMAERYGIAQSYDSWEEMIEKTRPEIVSITTPPHNHRAIAERAFEAGAHVLCEKPLTVSADDALAMAEAARISGLIGMTSFNMRFVPAMARFHEMVEGGYIGDHWYGDALFSIPRWVNPETPSSWRMDKQIAGVGALGDVGAHMIDLINWNMGRITRVAAASGIAHKDKKKAGSDRPMDTDDFTAFVGELESGAIIGASLSRVARGLDGGQDMTIHGSKATLHYHLQRQGPLWYMGRLEAGEGPSLQPVELDVTFPDSAGEGEPLEVQGQTSVASVVKHMLGAIEGGDRHPAPTFEDGARAQAVLDALVEASGTDRWVNVRQV
ncbi:MAG: hypothetical protein GEU28_03540 [Dehalococcoidia bacterium]|nr:hypothetical protein [Dehalococcoidia bacterium]